MDDAIALSLTQASEPAATVSDSTLNDYRAVALASFLGFPLAGSILRTLNYGVI